MSPFNLFIMIISWLPKPLLKCVECPNPDEQNLNNCHDISSQRNFSFLLEVSLDPTIMKVTRYTSDGQYYLQVQLIWWLRVIIEISVHIRVNKTSFRRQRCLFSDTYYVYQALCCLKPLNYFIPLPPKCHIKYKPIDKKILCCNFGLQIIWPF